MMKGFKGSSDEIRNAVQIIHDSSEIAHLHLLCNHLICQSCPRSRCPDYKQGRTSPQPALGKIRVDRAQYLVEYIQTNSRDIS
jgi:hypothetical protein